MTERAFPVVVASDVSATADFYRALGFEQHFQLPADGAPDYVGLRRGSSDIGVVGAHWPREQYGAPVAAGVRFEMFVYVEDVDATVERLRERRVPVLRDPADMPWGERLAYVTDPDGNPVALAAPTAQPT